MQGHATIFALILIICAESAAVTGAIHILRRRPVALWKRYLAFLCCFSLSVIEFLVLAYTRLNISSPPPLFSLVWGIVDGLTDLAVILSGVFFFHSLLRTRYARLFDGLATGLGLAGLIAFTLGLLYDLTGMQRINTGIILALGAYYLLFAWLIIICALTLRQVTLGHEKFLTWGLSFLVLCGFTEGILSAIGITKRGGYIAALPATYLSAIPWFAWCLLSAFLLPRLLPPLASVPSTAAMDVFAVTHGLSPREREILPAIARGLDNAHIADELCVSVATVKSHIHSILKKTGSTGRYEVVARIQSKG